MSKRRKNTKKESEISVQQRDVDYSRGERSPYREWQENKGDYNQEHSALDPVEASADTLSEEQSFWGHLEVSIEKKQLIEAILNSLTPKQRKVMELVGLEGKTHAHTAAILNMSVKAVDQIVFRIQDKFRNVVVGD